MSSFTIKFRQRSGALVEANVTADMTVEALKRDLAPRLETPVGADRLRLICLGRVMADQQTIGSYNVKDGQTLHILIRDADAATAPAPAQQQQPPRPQPPAEAPSATHQQPSLEREDSDDIFGTGASAGAPGAIDMAGLFRGLGGMMQNLGPMVAAASGGLQGGAGGAMPSFFEHLSRARGGFAAATPPAGPPQQQPADAPASASSRSAAPPSAPSPAEAARTTRTAPSATTSTSSPAASASSSSTTYHVHVHVTLDELEQLPGRLSRFRERMLAQGVNPQVQVHEHPAGAVPSTRSAADAAARTSRETASTQQQDLASILRDRGEDVAAGSERTLVTAMAEAFEGVGMPEAMGLMQGDWSVVDRGRPKIVEFVNRRTNGNATDALRDELVAEAAVDLVAMLEQNPQVQQAISTRVRPGVDAVALIRGGSLIFLRTTLDLALDGPSDAALSYSQAFRRAAVKFVGHIMGYAERKVVNSPTVDVDAIVQVALAAAVDKALESKPEMRPMAGMVPMLAMGTLRSWKAEYEAQHRNPNDDIKLEELAGRDVTVSTRPAHDTVADILNDALHDVQNGASPSSTAPQTEGDTITHLRAVLQSAGISAEEASDYAETARRDLAATRPTLPAEYFN